MLKVFLLLACAFVFVHAETESEEMKSNIKELSEMLGSKFNITIIHDLLNLVEKIDEKCPDMGEKIENAAKQVETCIEEIELGSDTLCQLIKKNFVRCSKPIRDTFMECVPDQSKQLPVLGEKVILALIDQVCNSTVEEILEIGNPCIWMSGQDTGTQCKKLKETLANHRDELPSKVLVCELIPKIKGCAKVELEAYCKNPITKNAHLNFYEAVEDATSESCDALNKT